MKKLRVPYSQMLLRRNVVSSMDRMAFYTLAGDWFTKRKSQRSTLRRQRFEQNKLSIQPRYVSNHEEMLWKQQHYPRWIWDRMKKGYKDAP